MLNIAGNILNNIISFLTKNIKMTLVIIIVIVSLLFFRQCEKTKDYKDEVTRITNNQIAMADKIKNYKNKEGNNAAEKKALTLKIEELRDSIKYEKNKPPVTIIETEFVIKDSIIEVPVYAKDTITGNNDEFKSALTFSKRNEFNKSWRNIDVFVPFNYNEGRIDYGNASINLEQKIWLNATLSRNPNTKEVYANVSTDYPNVTFNQANGIFIDPNNSENRKFLRSVRKTLGIGLHLGAGFNSEGFPTPVVSIGINYTPKFLQF